MRPNWTSPTVRNPTKMLIHCPWCDRREQVSVELTEDRTRDGQPTWHGTCPRCGRCYVAFWRPAGAGAQPELLSPV